MAPEKNNSEHFHIYDSKIIFLQSRETSKKHITRLKSGTHIFMSKIAYERGPYFEKSKITSLFLNIEV